MQESILYSQLVVVVLVVPSNWWQRAQEHEPIVLAIVINRMVTTDYEHQAQKKRCKRIQA